ncbi:hypothetical protein [Fodinicola feengrottensis]|uniref:hypothetical protein n=1 Tax=Fodinicola feengrottensis TaxID=435914 RepID=UPI0013D65122|nr:hypothetical protein [Fodinicola feengrottensis]
MRKTLTGSRSARVVRRVSLSAGLLLASAGILATTATPASADSGSSVALWIRASGGVINWEQWIEDEPAGVYNVHFWRAGGGWDYNTPAYNYALRVVPGNVYNVPVPAVRWCVW